MGFILDNIVRKVVVKGPEAVNSTWESPVFAVDEIEDGFSVELVYDSGVAVDMKAYLQFSNNKVSFSTDTESEIPFTDTDGTLLFDINDTATLFCRVLIEVTAGSISIESIELSGKRRH